MKKLDGEGVQKPSIQIMFFTLCFEVVKLYFTRSWRSYAFHPVKEKTAQLLQGGKLKTHYNIIDKLATLQCKNNSICFRLKYLMLVSIPKHYVEL